MPNIRLPDGSSKSFPAPVTVAEIAQAIGPGLARAALAGRVNRKLVDTGYRIDALERQLAERTREERQLQLEAAYLASPSQIERRAVAELGMQAPAMEQVVFWEELP